MAWWDSYASDPMGGANPQDWWTQNQPPPTIGRGDPSPDGGVATGPEFGAVQNLDFGGAYTPGNYVAPQFTDAAPTFSAPTDVTMQNDPGYLFRLQQSQQAGQRAAAAQGSVLNAGTVAALQRRAGDEASSEFGNVFARAGQTFQNNLATYGAKYNTFMGNAGLAKSAFDTNQANAFSARTLSDQEKQAQLTATTSQQNDYWQRLKDLAGAGQQASVSTVAA